MDLINAGHAYHVCTAMPLCPNVLLVTEALGKQESEGATRLWRRTPLMGPKCLIENPLGPKCPAAKVTDEHALVYALGYRYQRPYFHFILWIKSVSNVYNKMIWYTSHSEMITAVELMNIPYSHIVPICYVMRTPKIHTWQISKITQYSISNHSHHAVHYIPSLIHPT